VAGRGGARVGGVRLCAVRRVVCARVRAGGANRWGHMKEYAECQDLGHSALFFLMFHYGPILCSGAGRRSCRVSLI